MKFNSHPFQSLAWKSAPSRRVLSIHDNPPGKIALRETFSSCTFVFFSFFRSAVPRSEICVAIRINQRNLLGAKSNCENVELVDITRVQFEISINLLTRLENITYLVNCWLVVKHFGGRKTFMGAITLTASEIIRYNQIKRILVIHFYSKNLNK